MNRDRDRLFRMAGDALKPLQFSREDWESFVEEQRKRTGDRIVNSETTLEFLFSRFLLCTDLFEGQYSGRPEGRMLVRFVSYYDPREFGCENPLSRV